MITKPSLFCMVIGAVLGLSILFTPASATIPVTVSSVGCTYIQWNWTPGLDLTDMYIDGNVMCGYETTDPFYLATGLSPGELHNITIYTSGDSGTNLTRTIITNCTVPSKPKTIYVADNNIPLPQYIPVLAIIAAIFLITRRKER